MKFKSFYFLFILFIFSQTFYAQYSKYDFDLIKTTFERTFNKEIISAYLSDSNAVNVNAALLSIANSKDTSFIPVITKLNFYKYGGLLTFALGELGPSERSAKYLLSKINTVKDSTFLRFCYNALGKVGNQNDLNSLLNKTNYGIPLAFYQFNNRKINKHKNIILNNLFRTLLTCRNDSLKLNDVLFALSRIGADSSFIPLFTVMLFNSDKNISVQSKIYILETLNKLKRFPELPDLFNLVIVHDDWRIRTEAAKACSYYNSFNTANLISYINLLFDTNPNVARQAAISLKHINIPSQYREYVKVTLHKIISDNKLSNSVIGELFVSYCKLYQSDALNFIAEFKNIIHDKYIFKLISEVDFNKQFEFNFLKSKRFSISPVNENEYYTALMSLQDSLKHSEEYAQFVIENLKTKSPSAAGIIGSELSEDLINHKKLTLLNVITEFVDLHKNDDNYLEAITSLAEVSKKISSDFYRNILKKLSASKIFSIKKYSSDLLGLTIHNTKTNSIFNKLWAFSFKYRLAKVITNKGQFIILFTPSYAPISAANFCYLASNKFYNGVIFHRVVPNFVIQTGDKLGTGWGGPGYEIKSEFSPLPFNTSAVGMASAGRDTEGSQWFVMHSNFPHLNGRYTVFGYVISGQTVVDNINVADKIIRIDLIK